ncbi:MAG: platelet-activating factor acetylhydrolase IB subunit [Opitutales bacterium]
MISRLASLAAFTCLLSGCASLSSNYAVQPVLHPGTEKRHESFNEISKKGEAQLVFLGDSITHGWEGKGKAVWEKHWAPLKAANFGIGGDRTEHVLWRLEHGNFDGLKPKAIVLMIGTNNTGHQGRPQKELDGAVYQCTADQTAEGIKAIVGQLRKKCPDAKILVLGIFPRGANKDDKFRQQNEATNAIVKGFADGRKVFFLDVGAKFLEADGTLSKSIMPDLLHPNEKGYQIWTDAIKADVQALLR